jgi:hypothetical protein
VVGVWLSGGMMDKWWGVWARREATYCKCWHACVQQSKSPSQSTRQLIIGIVGSGGRGAQVVTIETLGEAAKLLPLFSG